MSVIIRLFRPDGSGDSANNIRELEKATENWTISINY